MINSAPRIRLKFSTLTPHTYVEGGRTSTPSLHTLTSVSRAESTVYDVVETTARRLREVRTTSVDT